MLPLVATGFAFLADLVACNLVSICPHPFRGLLSFVLFSFVEHAIYTLVWLNPKMFKKVAGSETGQEAVESVHGCFCACKVLQVFSSLLCADISAHSLPMPIMYLAAVAIILGPVLNFCVYKAIGKKGVSYGYKFNIEIPWVTTFPYNTPFPPP